MESLGVDENIAQGSGVSDPDGYESSSSEGDVFVSKKGEKGRGAAKKKGRTLLQPTESQDSFLGDDDVVLDSPERPASSDESFSSGTADLGSRSLKSMAKTATRTTAKTAESPHPSFPTTRRRSVSHLRADWMLFYLRGPSKSPTTASSPRPLPGQIFYSMFYSFPSQTIFYFILLLFYNFHPRLLFVRQSICYAPFTTRPRTPSQLKPPSP